MRDLHRALRERCLPLLLLLVLAFAPDADEPLDGPPWPLTRADIESFAVEGLEIVSVEEIRDLPETHRWRAVLSRSLE